MAVNTSIVKKYTYTKRIIDCKVIEIGSPFKNLNEHIPINKNM